MSAPFAELIAAWRDLKDAGRDMLAGPVPVWPWDRQSPEFVQNLRLRDRTQGRGMRFADIWRSCGSDIVALVDAHPGVFARYHVADRRGERIDPTPYMESTTIMPLLIAIRTEDA